MSLTSYDPPERFVAGTVGPPGNRTFFLQAREGTRISTMSVEKVHVIAIADRITDALEASGSLPAVPLPADNEPLDTPFEDDFRINTLALRFEADRRVVILECHDRDPDGDEEEQAQARAAGLPAAIQSVQVTLTAPMAAEFARRCKALVAAGRPPCPFCGLPLDPTGHICPRANGYRR